ncbi:hypothetical protein GZL_p00149 (plasmid) [Streptomyces sp. 769]|nr:hypothetical protein GZL_p00149 [Streptomyces sp. 769]
MLPDHCGRSTDRWAALTAAMTFKYDQERITFGELPARRTHPSADILT